MFKNYHKTELEFDESGPFKDRLRRMFISMIREYSPALHLGLAYMKEQASRYNRGTPRTLRQWCGSSFDYLGDNYDDDSHVDNYLGFINITGKIEFYITDGMLHDESIKGQTVVV